MLLTRNYILVKISGLQIINNTLLPDYDILVLFKDCNNLIADMNNVRYEFTTLQKFPDFVLCLQAQGSLVLDFYMLIFMR